MANANTLDIIRGISQAAANAYDGAHDGTLNSDGVARKVGLKREIGNLINDRRLVDGFKVRFKGPVLVILYQSETRLKDVAKKGFENEISQMIADIAKFLKKEYKSVTGNSLTLTRMGEPSVLVQKLSNYRTDVRATCDYKIGGIEDVKEIEEPSKDRLDKAIRDWLALGPGGKRPKNDTRKGK
tara:strand:- start:3102 stop:3653 length:552 start_codon:yes stop_codon:yes gene_type:complete